MIGPDQVVNGVWMGGALIVLAAVPGLYHALAERMLRLAERSPFHFPIRKSSHVEIKPPHWFAPIGLLIIAVTLLIYLAG
jgi:hypothetical protein